jgi:hypothetical protein
LDTATDFRTGGSIDQQHGRYKKKKTAELSAPDSDVVKAKPFYGFCRHWVLQLTNRGSRLHNELAFRRLVPI